MKLLKKIFVSILYHTILFKCSTDVNKDCYRCKYYKDGKCIAKEFIYMTDDQIKDI